MCGGVLPHSGTHACIHVHVHVYSKLGHRGVKVVFPLLITADPDIKSEGGSGGGEQEQLHTPIREHQFETSTALQL